VHRVDAACREIPKQLKPGTDHGTREIPKQLKPGTDHAYVYDALGNLANVTVGGVQISAMRFNAAGYREQITEVNTGLTTFVTDPLGRVKSQSNARGLTTQFNYDGLNRMTSRIDDSGGSSPVTNTWNWDAPNAIGALEYKISPGIREDYAYDALGRLTHQHSAINVTGFPANETYTTQFAYDAQSRTSSVTYSGHGAFTHHYTSRGYMEELRQSGVVLERITQHDAFGRPKHVQLGNGLETGYQHDLLGRINRITTGTASVPRGTQDLEYEWRSNGMLRLRRDYHNGAAAAWRESFAYDNLDRVYRSTTTGIGANRVLNYSYDTLGNLLTKTSSVAGDLNATNHSDGSAHRLSGATIAGIYTAFSYDPAGNIVQYLPATGPSTQLGYNSAGQVSSITVGSTAAPDAQDQFWYGPDGDRFMKRVTWLENGVARTGWTLYLLGGAYEHSRIVGDTSTAYRSEVQVSGTIVHRRTQLVNGTSTTAIEYRHRDHLGSTDVITNSAGAIVRSLAFDPYGGRRAANWTRDMSSSELAALLQSSSPAVQRGFTDHEHLDRTGFIHMNGRVYDPRTARFVQPDPIVQSPGFSQSYNRYAYTFNSPMSFTDPSGFQSSADGDAYTGPCDFLCVFTSTVSYPMRPVEVSGVEVWGQYIYESWRNSTIPRLRSEHRVASSAVGGYLFPALNEGTARPMDANGEPDDISDSVTINKGLLNRNAISILDAGNHTSFTVKIPYGAYGYSEIVDYLRTDLTAYLSKPVTNNGHSISVEVILIAGSGESYNTLPYLSIRGCSMRDCSGSDATPGGNSVRIYRPRSGTGTHEILHILGLWHQSNKTGSIMSYAESRRLRYEDAARLVDAYRPRLGPNP
jgi:RHS repeat-associated protein